MEPTDVKELIVNTIRDELGRSRPYLNRRDAAKYFGVADSTISYWATLGMPVARIDGRKLYGKESITEWLKSKEQTKKPVTNHQ